VSISAADVRSMYLGEKQFAAGVKLQLADNASLQSASRARHPPPADATLAAKF